ncbi:MAG: IS5 family transposase [Chloroflexota bacterium]
MRGRRRDQVSMLGFLSLEERIPAQHPLRMIKRLADEALARVSPQLDRMYSHRGRHSIPSEQLLKGTLLMSLYSIRSERQLCEQLEYNLLFRWFLDLDGVDPVFDASTFSKNRTRFLESGVGEGLFDALVAEAKDRGLLSQEHFTVDGTLIEAAASLKSLRRKDGTPPTMHDDDPGNPSVDFHGERRSNATHQSTTDDEALLAKKGKGKEAKLSFCGHALMENRHGVLVDFQITRATGTAERDMVPELLDAAQVRDFRPKTLGGDKGYDTRGCVEAIRERGVTPHIAAKRSGGAIDGRTTRHQTYRLSQRIRKRVEEIFGWMKTIGGFRRTRFIGVARTGLAGYLVATAYNLLRLGRLMTSPPSVAVA